MKREVLVFVNTSIAPDWVVVITGPTAVGKTDVSIKVAEQLGGEIVSCDSMQVYKYMDIGTAKPSLIEREKCRIISSML